MILVDSCVWIDLLKGNQTAAVRRLVNLKNQASPEIVISGVIYFEVLRGVVDDLQRKKVQNDLAKLERKDFADTDFEKLVALSHAARRKGIQLVKLGDWLIIKTLLDHDLSLLTSDRDFKRIQKVIPIKLEPTSEDGTTL